MDEQEQLLNVLDSIETAFDVADWPNLDDEAATASDLTESATPTVESTPPLPPDAGETEALPLPITVRPPSVDVAATRRTYPETPPPIQRVPKLRLSTRAFLEQFNRRESP